MTSILNKSRDSGRKSPDRRVSFGIVERYDISLSNKLESQLPPSPKRERSNWLISSAQLGARVRRALTLAFVPSYGDTVTFGEVRDFLIEYEIVLSSSQATELFVVDTISSLFPSVCVKPSAKYSFIFVNLENRVHDVVKEELINVTTEDIEPLESHYAPDAADARNAYAKPNSGIPPADIGNRPIGENYGPMSDMKTSISSGYNNSQPTLPYKSYVGSNSFSTTNVAEFRQMQNGTPRNRDDSSSDKIFKTMGTSDMIVLSPAHAKDQRGAAGRQGLEARESDVIRNIHVSDLKSPASPDRILDDSRSDKKGFFHKIKENFTSSDTSKNPSPTRGYTNSVDVAGKVKKFTDDAILNGYESTSLSGTRTQTSNSPASSQPPGSFKEVGNSGDGHKRLGPRTEDEQLSNCIVYIVDAPGRSTQAQNLTGSSKCIDASENRPLQKDGFSEGSYQERGIDVTAGNSDFARSKGISKEDRLIDQDLVSTKNTERMVDAVDARTKTKLDRDSSKLESNADVYFSAKSVQESSSDSHDRSFLHALSSFWEDSPLKRSESDANLDYSDLDVLNSSGSSLKRSKSMQFSKRSINTDPFRRTGSLSERRGVAKNSMAAQNRPKSASGGSTVKDTTVSPVVPDKSDLQREQNATPKKTLETVKVEKVESLGEPPSTKKSSANLTKSSQGDSARSSVRAANSGSMTNLSSHTTSSFRGSNRELNRLETQSTRSDEQKNSMKGTSHLINRSTASSKAKMVSTPGISTAQKKVNSSPRETPKPISKPAREKRQEKDFAKISSIFSDHGLSEGKYPDLNHVTSGVSGSSAAHDNNGRMHRNFKLEENVNDPAEFIELFLRDIIENDFHEVAGARIEMKSVYKHIRKRCIDIERSGGFTPKVDFSKLEINQYFDVFFEILASKLNLVGCELSFDKTTKEKELYLVHVEIRHDFSSAELNSIRAGPKHKYPVNKKTLEDIDESVAQSLV